MRVDDVCELWGIGRVTKTFTLAEAQVLLPVLEALLGRAQIATGRVAELEEEMQRLNHRIFLSGGMRVNVAVEARRKAEREKAAQQVKSALEEIEAIGVRVHDLTGGMLDFPCLVNGQTVLLCWRLGEPAVVYWHGDAEEKSETRRRVEELFGKPAERKRPN